MPKTSAKALAAKAAYNRKPGVQAARVENNKSRREKIADGSASVGDGKDVAHVKSMGKTGPVGGKTVVQDRKTNRGWRKREPEMYANRKTTGKTKKT